MKVMCLTESCGRSAVPSEDTYTDVWVCKSASWKRMVMDGRALDSWSCMSSQPFR